MNTTIKKALAGLACGLVMATCGSALAANPTNGIEYSPYMIYPNVPSEMQVLWMDWGTETDTISWGTDTTYSGGSFQSTEYNTTTSTGYPLHQHAYTITGLNTNTKYYYQVTDVNGVVYNGSFWTAPNLTDTHVKIFAQGDSRSQPWFLDGLDQQMIAFYNYTPDGGQTYPNAEYQRLSIANGDWVSTDGDSYWNTQWFMPTQTNVRAYTANTPMNGCKGNHDNSGSGYSATFPKYYPYPYPTSQGAFTPTGTKDGDGNPYYSNLFWSFDYGPIHFTVIDEYSPMGPGSAQYTFVQNDLAAAQAAGRPWKIVIYHEPAFNAGSDGDNTGVQVYESLYNQYGVDMTFSGHSHNYCRAGVYNATQQGPTMSGGYPIAMNMPHITSGGGGAPIYQPDLSNAGSYPYVITAWPCLEFMTFDVEGNTLTMTSYQINNVTDTGTTSTPPASTNYSISPIETTVLHHYPNVTPQVSAQLGNLVYNHTTKTYNGTVTITNNGAALSGDLHVVLDGIINLQGINTNILNSTTTASNQTSQLSNQYSTANPRIMSMIANNPGAYVKAPAGTGLNKTITLVNQTGSNNGEPMINAGLNGNGLASGASVTVPLKFTNSGTGAINFNPVILNELPGE
jgi:hypothetical protein